VEHGSALYAGLRGEPLFEEVERSLRLDPGDRELFFGLAAEPRVHREQADGDEDPGTDDPLWVAGTPMPESVEKR
jgi:hypothetical protein